MFKRRIGIFYRAHDGLQHRSGIGQHGRRFGYSGHYLCPLDVWRIRANSAKTGGSRSTIVVLRPVFSIDLSADNRAAPPTLPDTKRYRVTGCSGVLGATKRVSGGVLWRGAGLEAAGLGAEHLDYAAGDKANTGANERSAERRG
jgi:hypothetical protein